MSDKVRHYADEEIDITYDSRRCIHVAECIRGLPAVFDTGTSAVDPAHRCRRGRNRCGSREMPKRSAALYAARWRRRRAHA